MAGWNKRRMGRAEVAITGRQLAAGARAAEDVVKLSNWGSARWGRAMVRRRTSLGQLNWDTWDAFSQG